MLSRILKQPRVSGIHDYLIPGPAAAEPPGAVALGEAGERSPSPDHPVPPGGVGPAEGESDPASETTAPSGEERARIAEEGYRRGLEEGRAEVEARSGELLEEAARRLEEAHREAEACLQQARQGAREIIAASEAEIVKLAVAVAEKLIHDQLEIAPWKVSRIVQEAMRLFTGEGEQLQVYLHPADLSACRKSLELFADSAESRLMLLPDEGLSRGSCRIESESSIVEHLLKEELDKIRETLLETAAGGEESVTEGEVPAHVSP